MYKFTIYFVVNISAITGESNQVENKFIGGKETTVEEFPFQVSIQDNETHVCSGSIISPDIIIGAAHCVYDNHALTFKIRAGATDCSSDGNMYDIQFIYIHPSYNQDTYDYDVALLKLPWSLTFDIRVSSIDIVYKDQEVAVGTKGVCSGWIIHPDHEAGSKHLQYALAHIISNKECQSLYNESITDRMICARFVERRQRICQDDSGGPLVANGQLVGILSWGQGCSKRSYPEIYTNLAKVRSFIKSVANV